MIPKVATQVMDFETSKNLWEAIQDFFGVQSRVEEDYLRQVFQESRKNNLLMFDYLRLMKNHADNLGQAGSLVTTRNLISQVLLGLDEEYNSVVAMIQGRVNISWSEMQVELLVFEKRLELQNTQKNTTNSLSQTSSVNMVSSRFLNSPRPQGVQTNSNRSNFSPRGNYNNGGRGRGRGRGRGSGKFNNRPTCQVCGKFGHLALVYYHRFDKEFAPNQNKVAGGKFYTQQYPNAQQPTAFVASQNTNPFLANAETVMDPNWYADSGASNHVTGDYNNVRNPVEYGGHEQVTVGNGNRLPISCVSLLTYGRTSLELN